MDNLITRTTELAMRITRAYIKPGDTVIDATCGTGRDTAALAEAVEETGRVYAFDVQDKAIALTEEAVKARGFSNVKLIRGSFEQMDEHVTENSAAAVTFNLGYLPGGDHGITTMADTTIRGLETALKVIRPGGIVTVVMYSGHPEGAEEKKRVLEWAEALDPKRFHAVFTDMLNQKNEPPEILWITKKNK